MRRDALFPPNILNKTARVESKDPMNGEVIRLTVGPHSLESYPPGTYFSLVAPGMHPEETSDSAEDAAKPAGIDGMLCNGIDFFTGKDSAEKWLAGRHKPGLGREILPVEEGIRLSIDIWAHPITG